MGSEVGEIRGILFDAGNTLVRVRGTVGAVYAEVARRHGFDPDGEALERAFQRAFRERKASFLLRVSRPHSPGREKTWWREVVEAVFRGAGAWGGLDGRFEETFEELYREFEKPDHWEVFRDAAACLDVLAFRGVGLGVVSNWDSRLHPVLAGLGLAPRFRFVLTSAEFGAEKPDPSIFREGARLLGLPPHQVLHVGDLIRDDWQGAIGAGLRAALVDREGTCPVGIHCLSSLAEVPALLGWRASG